MARTILAFTERVPTRDRLLQATSELLSERDTLDVSLMEIAARSGLTHGLVKYHFGGKEGLLLALLERDATKAINALTKLVNSDIPPLLKLEFHVRGVIKTYFTFPYINRLINYLQYSDENAEKLANIFVMPLRKYQLQILEECYKNNSIKRVDPACFYYSTIGSCELIFHSRKTFKFLNEFSDLDENIINNYSNHVVNIMLNGLKI